MAKKKAKKPERKRGPKEERLQIDGNWKDAVKKAVRKQRQKDWPEQTPGD